ncbi:MAG: cell division protein ZapD [Glaciecola sp.]
MSVALYEFPLSEKVRNYLRLEQLFAQLHEAKAANTEYQYLHFLELLFNVMDLVERLDLRTDFLRDIDVYEKSLVQWSQHPDIDTSALKQALQSLHSLSGQIKQNKKLGSSLREDRFLANIRQRFSITGGVNSFDLPSLFCWFKQTDEVKREAVEGWLAQLALIQHALHMLLSFLREKSRFQEVSCNSGFYQGSVEERLEIVRIKCNNDGGIYPVVSGSRNRYGIKFMRLAPNENGSSAVTTGLTFQLACC